MLGIGERQVLWQDNELRIVGEGLQGWKLRVYLEYAQKDAMKETTWIIGRVLDPTREDENDGEGGEEGILILALRKLIVVQRQVQ